MTTAALNQSFTVNRSFQTKCILNLVQKPSKQMYRNKLFST